MGNLKITQVKSTINRTQKQKDTIKTLGLGRINKVVEKEATPQILGMVKKVLHLIKVEEV